MKRTISLLSMTLLLIFGLWPIRPAFAFNLWEDIQQQTRWLLGDAAAGGTAFNLRNGDASYSALAGLSSYRFLSAWYGGTKVNKTDSNMTDTFKVGLNLSYILAGFVNRPPDLLNHLVVGPSFAIPVFSTPRKGTPFIDINYQFGATAIMSATLAPPAVREPAPEPTSRLNLYPVNSPT